MKKFLAALGAIGIAAFIVTNANAADTVASNFFTSTPGATSVLDFNGQLQCMVQINAPVGNIQATPQFSADGTNWDTATVIGGGLIGQAGVFIGTVPVGPGYLHFRLFLNRISVPISGQLVCGDSLPPSQGSGTGTVTSVAASVPLQSSGGAAPVIKDLTLPPNLVNFGAACDGTTNDLTVYNAATYPLQIPLTDCKINESFAALNNGAITGYGRLLTVEGAGTEPRANNTATITALPSYPGSPTTLSQFFNGDYTATNFNYEKYVAFGSTCSNSESATLGCPTGGTYLVTEPAGSIVGFVENDSGFSNPADSNSRTALLANNLHISMGSSSCGVGGRPACNVQGQGDMYGYNVTANSNSTAPSGAASNTDEPLTLSFVAQNAASQDNSGMQSFLAQGRDNGHNDSYIGYQVSEFRTVAAGTPTPDLGNFWEGVQSNNRGTVAVDAAMNVRGPHTIGYDATNMTIGVVGMAMPHDVGVYYNSVKGTPTLSRNDVVGTTFCAYINADAALECKVAGTVTSIQKASQTGQLTCTPGAARFCTQTATVVAGSVCVAQWDTAATAATIDNLQYVSQKVVGTTLTVRMETTDSESAVLAADYRC